MNFCLSSRKGKTKRSFRVEAGLKLLSDSELSVTLQRADNSTHHRLTFRHRRVNHSRRQIVFVRDGRGEKNGRIVAPIRREQMNVGTVFTNSRSRPNLASPNL